MAALGLEPPENAPTPAAQPAQIKSGQQIDYQGNLLDQNSTIQKFNNDNYNQQRRQAPNKGVKVEKAY